MIHHRRTVVAHGRMAAREHRVRTARGRGHGLQIMTFEHLTARMAGGMCRPVEDEELRRVVQQALPATDLGELDAIKELPGMVSASVDTLRKAWRADINLQERAGDHPRIRAVAQLEAAVLEALPSTMKRPGDLAAAALERLEHAPAILGPIDIVGITELSPCWRSLLHGLASRVPVRWIAGPRTVPPWLNREVVEVVEGEPQAPEVVAVRAATAFHEAIEALRWARELVSSGAATPAEIAIASVWPAEYDDHLLALRRDANLNLHFVHGVKATASREGQAAAALADVLLQGLSQSRVRRLNALLSVYPGPFQALPAGWVRALPVDAPLSSREAWERLVNRLGPADWPDGTTMRPRLLDVVTMLARGIEEAEETGEALLHGRGAGNLANGASQRSRRVPGSHARDAKARGRFGALRLNCLDAGERARGLSAELRAPARSQLLALAPRALRRSDTVGPHHPDLRARSATGQHRRSSRLRDHPCHHIAPSSFSPRRDATAKAVCLAAAPCSRDNLRPRTCRETPCRSMHSARPIG